MPIAPSNKPVAVEGSTTRVRVRMLFPHGGHGVGDLCGFDPSSAAKLVRQGIVEYVRDTPAPAPVAAEVKEEPPAEPEADPEPAPEAPAVEPAPAPARRRRAASAE